MLGDVGDFIVPSAEPLNNSLIELQMNNTTTSAPIFANQVLPAVLHLTLTKKWFDMIASGEKKEEYRELKKHWINRFVIKDYRKYSTQLDAKDLLASYREQPLFNSISNTFDYVEFKNGYSKKAPTLLLECKGITIGNAKPEWSDGFKDKCFVIALGKLVMSAV